MHAGGNPKQGTKSADTIPNHYENLNASRKENSGGHSLPPDAHGERAHTLAWTPFKNMQACLERTPREGYGNRVWWERNSRRRQPRAGHEERKWNPKHFGNINMSRRENPRRHGRTPQLVGSNAHTMPSPKLSRKENSSKGAKEIVVGAKYTSEPAQKQGAKGPQVRYDQYDNPYLFRRKNV